MRFSGVVHHSLLASVETVLDRKSVGIYKRVRPWPYNCWATLNNTRNKSACKHEQSVVHNGGALGDEHPVINVIFHHTVRDFGTKQLSLIRKNVKEVTHIPGTQ